MSWSTYHHDGLGARLKRILGNLWEFAWKGGLTLLIPLLLLTAWYAWKASQFDLTKVEEIPARTILIDRHGEELGTVHGENRRLIAHDEIPDFLIRCLYAREDSRFLDHEGVDFIGLARATVRNLKDFDFTQGASTLSMQLARNSFDLREKKSLNRKFLEIALTYRIESKFSKDEILTHYLNRIYFGAGCEGIEEAALTYFGRKTTELHRGQSALLIGIIRAPHACSPWRSLEGAVKQRDEVLARLKTIGDLTDEEVEMIKNKDLGLREPYAEIPETSHACRALRRPLEVVLGETEIKGGGLRAVTTFDAEIQRKLEKLGREAPLPEDHQIAAIALDPQNGDVLGIIGCRDENPTGFNRALDASRDLGKEMVEPLVATIALERGHLPVKGRPVATARALDFKDAEALLRRFDLKGKFGSGEDLFRGTMLVSPMELAVAYATILREGSRPTPYFIRELWENEDLLFERPPKFFPAFSDHAQVDGLPTILSGRSLPKTDYWAAALNPKLVVVVWTGSDPVAGRPKPFQPSQALQSKINSTLRSLLNEVR